MAKCDAADEGDDAITVTFDKPDLETVSILVVFDLRTMAVRYRAGLFNDMREQRVSIEPFGIPQKHGAAEGADALRTLLSEREFSKRISVELKAQHHPNCVQLGYLMENPAPVEAAAIRDGRSLPRDLGCSPSARCRMAASAATHDVKEIKPGGEAPSGKSDDSNMSAFRLLCLSPRPPGFFLRGRPESDRPSSLPRGTRAQQSKVPMEGPAVHGHSSNAPRRSATSILLLRPVRRHRVRCTGPQRGRCSWLLEGPVVHPTMTVLGLTKPCHMHRISSSDPARRRLGRPVRGVVYMCMRGGGASRDGLVLARGKSRVTAAGPPAPLDTPAPWLFMYQSTEEVDVEEFIIIDH